MGRILCDATIGIPGANVLSQKFITDGADVALAGELVSDFDCETRQAADNFTCVLQPSACVHCEPDQSKVAVNCQCRDLVIEDLFRDPLTALPVHMARLELKSIGGNVFVETSYAPVQISVRMTNLRLITETQHTRCTVTPLGLSGCYKCATGGEFKFKCVTEHDSALAKIECEDGTIFAERCDLDGRIHTSIIAFNSTDVDTSCTVQCPGGGTTFRMKGKLLYLSRQLRGRYLRTRSRDVKTNDGSTGILSWVGLNTDFDWIGIWSFIRDFTILQAYPPWLLSQLWSSMAY